MEWKIFRYKALNTFFLDQRKIYKELSSVLPSREEYTKAIVDRDIYDVSKYPTHRMLNPDGSYSYNYAASKHFELIDPYTTDKHSLHYAPNHWVYLLLKSKKTKEWEFPTQILRERQAILDAKNEMFTKITGDEWTIQHYLAQPVITTSREFTAEEKSIAFYMPYHGVRCFYFLACHKGGIPSIVKNNENEYEDFAWVAKREMNKFLPKDTFNELKKVLWDL